MATWDEMSRDSLKSARKLLEEDLLRRSISSSYYGVYSAVTFQLVDKKVVFAHGWKNPGHDQLPNLILANLNLSRNAKHTIRKYVVMLRQAREDADYRPHKLIDKQRATESVVFANRVIKLLEGEL